jgi:hypothetical protein
MIDVSGEKGVSADPAIGRIATERAVKATIMARTMCMVPQDYPPLSCLIK